MATNKLLPFANGVGANVTDYDTWSALATLLSQGFTTGVARSDYANRVFAQGALASYILGQFVVDQTAQDADLNETTFYTNFKNALINYIKANAVSLDTAQTVGGVKTFTSSPVVPTKTTGDSSTDAASTAFVQGELTSQAVKLTGAQTVDGVKTFTSSPVIPTKTSGDNSTDAASTAFVQTEIANQAVKFNSAQTLTDAEKTQARSNIGSASDSDVVKLATTQTITGDKNFTGALQKDGKDIIPNDIEEIEATFTSNVVGGGIWCAIKLGKFVLVSFDAEITETPGMYTDVPIITLSVTAYKRCHFPCINNDGYNGILQIGTNGNTIIYRTLHSSNRNSSVRGAIVFVAN